MLSFLCRLIWFELNYIAICLCNKHPDVIFLLNQLVVYLPSTAMSSQIRNHMMDLLYLLKEDFKKPLFNSLITGMSYKNLSYLSSCLLSQRWRFRRIHSNVLRLIESALAYTKVLRINSQYGSSWYPQSSSMLKSKRIFSLVFSKLMSAFSL